MDWSASAVSAIFSSSILMLSSAANSPTYQTKIMSFTAQQVIIPGRILLARQVLPLRYPQWYLRYSIPLTYSIPQFQKMVISLSAITSPQLLAHWALASQHSLWKTTMTEKWWEDKLPFLLGYTIKILRGSMSRYLPCVSRSKQLCASVVVTNISQMTRNFLCFH